MWKCHKCGKPVYFAERKQSLGYDWHPECLRCEECGKRLNPGQHAEHKGVPYCHVPCYGALFGPQLFGHGTRVESHKSFGQKAQKSIGPNLCRATLDAKLKAFNEYYDGKAGEVRSREVNGRLILEGALRVHWGVRGLIHLKEDDDQRTVVTVRKRNSTRFSDYHSPSITSSKKDDSPYDSRSTLKDIASPVEECAADDVNISLDDDPVTTDSYKSLPSNLSECKIYDELDELLQVERPYNDGAKLYKTLSGPLSNGNTYVRLTSDSSTNTSYNTANGNEITDGTITPSVSDSALDSNESSSSKTLNDDNCHSLSTDTISVDSYYTMSDETLTSIHDNASVNSSTIMTTSTTNRDDCWISISNKTPTSQRHASNDTANQSEWNSDTDCDDLLLVENVYEENHSSTTPRSHGSTTIRRRPGAKRTRAKLKRRCSINGHFYDRETSFFTPPYGSQMSVWVTSCVNTQDVISLILEKYKVDSSADNFALFVVRDSGEQRRLRDDEYPLVIRVLLGPHEDVAKLFLFDRHTSAEVSYEVAQFLNLSVTECRAILQQYRIQEEREMEAIAAKYVEMRQRIKQRMDELKVRL